MRRFLLFFYVAVLMLLTGCWDELPIDENGFVVGAAIDIAEEGATATPQLILTNQFVIPSALSHTGQEGGGGGEDAFHNLPVMGQSAFQIYREMLNKTDWIPNLEHLKVLIVSNEIASDPDLFSSVFDIFIRDHEIRRGVRVIIADGVANEILNKKPKTEEIPALFIETILENNVKSLELIEPVQLGELHNYLLGKTSYVLPQFSVHKDNIVYSSVAVFDGKSDYQVGTLTGEEIKGFNLIKGRNRNGAIQFHVNNQLMMYELYESKSTIDINADDPENINISITVDTEGSVAETFGSRTLLDQSHIKQIEKKISERIEQIINNTVTKAQQDLKVDYLGFSEKLRQKHYKEWKKIEENWEHGDHLFSQSTVDVSVEAFVRSIGASDQAEQIREE